MQGWDFGEDWPFAKEHREELAWKCARIDFDAAWRCCGKAGQADEGFRSEIADCLRGYQDDPRIYSVAPTTADRKKVVKALVAPANRLLAVLSREDDDFNNMMFELVTIYHANAEDPDAIYPKKEYEGFHYGEYRLDLLQNLLTELTENLEDWLQEMKTPRGRRVQNPSLHRTIRQLGAVYERHAGLAPMQRFAYDAVDPHRPCKGPFVDLLMFVIWGFNGREYPLNNALGETARTVFSARS